MQRGALGARSLNADLQKALNPNPSARIEKFGSVFAPGDKIMQTENDYDRDVFNGDLGTVLRIDEAEGLLVAGFDGREVEYPFGELDALLPAYAMTIHKSQGSEYPAVVITLATQHYTMLARNLVYTAVTRGKRLVVIVGQRRAMAIAVRNPSARIERFGSVFSRRATRSCRPRTITTATSSTATLGRCCGSTRLEGVLVVAGFDGREVEYPLRRARRAAFPPMR